MHAVACPAGSAFWCCLCSLGVIEEASRGLCALSLPVLILVVAIGLPRAQPEPATSKARSGLERLRAGAPLPSTYPYSASAADI